MNFPGRVKSWVLSRLFDRYRPSAYVLTYHRVVVSKESGRKGPYKYTLSIDKFRRELDFLRSRFRIVSLDQWIAGMNSVQEPPTVCLTFDDGFRNFKTTAFPILRERGLPATLFVCPRFMERTRAPFEYVLYGLIERVHPVEVEIDGNRYTYSTRTPADRENAYESIRGHLRGRSPQTRDQLLHRWLKEHELSDSFLGNYEGWMLSNEEVKDLAKQDLLTVGAHGYSHRRLANLDEDVQQREIINSRVELESLLDQTVDYFCYPYGVLEERTVEIVKSAGYRAALQTGNRPLFEPDLYNPYRIPRLGECPWQDREFWLGLGEY